MSRQDIEFKSSDDVTLRGWFYTPSTPTDSKLPCLVMLHGFSAVKEMDLDNFAEQFLSKLDICVLVYDNRGFGASDAAPGQPRQEIIPALQASDLQDAITYAQSRKEVDPEKVGVWGSSYAGGHVLYVAAIDRRVKACISQVPLVYGWETFHRLIRPDFIAGLNANFAADRQARAAGHPAGTLPVVDSDPLNPSALPTADSYAFFKAWEAKSPWKNETTVRSIEALRAYNPAHLIHCISPTPLLMIVQDADVLVPLDLSLRAYAAALEPKELVLLKGGHFEAYKKPNIDVSVARQIEFLKGSLCA